MDKIFTEDNVWFGGFYELAIEIGKSPNENLHSSLIEIWNDPLLDGCYLDRNREPYEQDKINPLNIKIENVLHLQGLIRLPNNKWTACGTCIIMEDEGSDWLDFYIPLGSLSKYYDTDGYPFNEKNKNNLSWQSTIDDLLSTLGNNLFSKVNYKLGLIGFEVSGEYYSENIKSSGIPEKREIGFLSPTNSQIKYYPKNI
jgi:hypothetical protein